jgi:hypothetical protein
MLSQTYLGLLVYSARYFLPTDFNQSEFSQQISINVSITAQVLQWHPKRGLGVLMIIIVIIASRLYVTLYTGISCLMSFRTFSV